ncbi:MAG: mannosyltransferase family protein [Candidatus Velthaea sp.]
MQAISTDETETAGGNLATVGGASRFAPAGLAAAAGWPAVGAVAGGGLTAGFFGWYALISRAPHGPLFLEGTFLAALALGVAGAFVAWSAYARYFARRTDMPLGTALRYDAATWPALVLMWAALLSPVGASATGRAVALSIGLFALAKVTVAAYFNRTVRDVAVTFLVTRISILVIAELAATVIGQRPGQHFAASANPLLAVWGRWDAEHYLGIATQGYHGTEMAFFPLYPLLIKLVGALTGNHLVAGLIVSNVASFFGLLFFYKLVEHQYNRQVAHRATFYVSIFPTAIFFSAVYTESLFFALTVASFYFIRERKWVTAGIVGYFASLTRVEGVLLAVPFFIEWLAVLGGSRASVVESLKAAVKWPADNILRPIAGLALVPAGLATYMAYLWVLRGDPLYFSHVQAHWGRQLAPPWTSFSHTFMVLTHAHAPQTIANEVQEIAFTVLMLFVLIAGWKRLRFSYWAYMALSILIPMSTSSLMSMPRFALVLFPMFVMFGLWGERPSVNNAIVAFSMPLLGLFTVFFADWYWVA